MTFFDLFLASKEVNMQDFHGRRGRYMDVTDAAFSDGSPLLKNKP